MSRPCSTTPKIVNFAPHRKSPQQLAFIVAQRMKGWEVRNFTQKQLDGICRVLAEQRAELVALRRHNAKLKYADDRHAVLTHQLAQMRFDLRDIRKRLASNLLRRRKNGLPDNER